MAIQEKLGRFLSRLRGEPIDHDLRGLRRALDRIDALEPEMTPADDTALRRRAESLRRAAAGGADVTVEGVALAREAGRRVLGMRLHDVQVMAAVALHQGKLVELATGEGKTLAAVAPAWLSSLTGKGVHVLTFNDYLARRDAAWMGPVHEFLGSTVGCIQADMLSDQRRHAYAQDITYATAKQAGFDYLRDGRALHADERVQRPFHHALIDEADSLLIDEARVPLVLAGGRFPHPVDPHKLTELARLMTQGRDYEMDEYARNVMLTEDGVVTAEKHLGMNNLHDESHRDLLTALNLALHAEVLVRRDVDYIVRDGDIQVVDEFTGRVVPERRWPDGLHPALEAKEGLEVRPEGVVLASMALQHFFRLYPRLSGMSATLAASAEEMHEFYGVEVVVIPPHQECIRRDEPDAVFVDRLSKQSAVVQEVRRAQSSGRPVLVGTANVTESEDLAGALTEAGIRCEVLNARNDEEEARIIAEAGSMGAVTISTNMAGRGTDIRLGGSSEAKRDEVAALGGLHVIGTNKHESSRLDLQLRGRAGRQGDPGSSRFFVSLEDDLIQRYGIAGAIAPLLEGRTSGPAESDAVVEEVARAQRIVDGQNFEVRRTLWRYSSMVEQQRRILADQREHALLESPGLEHACPAQHAALVEQVGLETAAVIERRVALLKCDLAWSGQLARIADIREAIHLQHMASADAFGGLWALRKTPIDVFHEMAIEAFQETRDSLEEATTTAFQSLEITPDGLDLEGDELKGPGSTWTYIINDTPFESAIIRMSRNIQRARSPRQPPEGHA